MKGANFGDDSFNARDFWQMDRGKKSFEVYIPKKARLLGKMDEKIHSIIC